MLQREEEFFKWLKGTVEKKLEGTEEPVGLQQWDGCSVFICLLGEGVGTS